MASNDSETGEGGDNEFLDPAGHSPVFSRKRKTTTRPKKVPRQRAGGVMKLESMFASAQTASTSATEHASPAGDDSTSGKMAASYPASFDRLPFRSAGVSIAGETQTAVATSSNMASNDFETGAGEHSGFLDRKGFFGYDGSLDPDGVSIAGETQTTVATSSNIASNDFETGVGGDSEFLGPAGHSPVFSRERKSTTPPQKVPWQSAGGGIKLESMFASAQTASTSATEHASPAGDDSTSGKMAASYPASSDQLLFRSAVVSISGETQTGDVLEGVAGSTADAMVDEDSPLPIHFMRYSNEARVYHCKYSELADAHEQGRHDYCRDGCLDLLTEPRLPLGTRVQVLQMVSTLFDPMAALKFLQDADILLEGLDDDPAMQILQDDNDKMMDELCGWSQSEGEEGEEDDGEGEEDETASAETEGVLPVAEEPGMQPEVDTGLPTPDPSSDL